MQQTPSRPSNCLAPRSSLLAPRPAFTLFELIVAIALSATLLVLIGTAINLYLLRVDASRNEVEQSQLARNVLAMIAADIRATSVYQTQDISAIAQLAAATAAVDVDTIDKSGTFQASALKTLSTLQTKGTLQAANGQSSSSSGTSGSNTSGSNSSGDSSSDSSTSSDQSPTNTVPGLNGSVNELILDVNRLPRSEDLFPPGQQPTAASSSSSSSSAASRPTDGETVRYFIRQGNTVDPSDIAATSLGGAAQQQAGGLVRQTVDQAVRTMAEQGGSSDVLNTGQVLIAPEVVQIEFHYYDATQGQAVDTWSMQDQKTMPSAVEVRIWLAANGAGTSPTNYSSTGPSDGQMYSETIDLPLAAAAGTTASANSSGSNSSDSSSDSNSSGSSSSGGSGQSTSSGSKASGSGTGNQSKGTSSKSGAGNATTPGGGAKNNASTGRKLPGQ
jgi:type II secretory pathway pseudopilin PulG